MEKIEITTATVLDIPHILRFIRELAIYEKLEHEVIVTAQDLEKNLFGENPHAEVIFIERAGVKVGFALYFINFSTFLGLPGIYLEDLFVLPQERGHGFGKRLLAHIAKIAVDRGYGRFEWSVLDWNIPAIEFYRSIGAKPMSEWTVQRLTGDSLKKLSELA